MTTAALLNEERENAIVTTTVEIVYQMVKLRLDGKNEELADLIVEMPPLSGQLIVSALVGVTAELMQLIKEGTEDPLFAERYLAAYINLS